GVIVVIVLAIQVEVFRHQSCNDSALMQQRVLEVDDLAQKLPGMGVLDEVSSKRLAFLVGLFIQFESGITHVVVPPGTNRRDQPLQGFRIFTSDISVCELVEFFWSIEGSGVEGVTEICQCICRDLVLNMGASIVRFERLQNGGCFINEVNDHRLWLWLIWEYSV